MKFSKLGVILALAVLAFPLAAMADNTITWTNINGTFSASTSGMSITGSQVVGVSMGGITTSGNLGTISLTTGALMTGSLTTGCMATSGGCSFSWSGSSFTISGAGGGPSFKGTFTSDITLSGALTAGGKYTYTISGGVLTGTMTGTGNFTGGTTQLTITLSHPFTGGKINLAGGSTNVTAVPEPGTLGLLGSGLFGLACVLRRRLMQSS